MKNIKEVCEQLNITEKQLKNLIDPSRNHRKILDKLGCYKDKNTYLFNEEGIKYIAYQYMSKSDECFYYIYSDKKTEEVKIEPNKVIKNIKVAKKGGN